MNPISIQPPFLTVIREIKAEASGKHPHIYTCASSDRRPREQIVEEPLAGSLLLCSVRVLETRFARAARASLGQTWKTKAQTPSEAKPHCRFRAQIQGHALENSSALSALLAAVCAEAKPRRSRLEQAQRRCFIPSSCYQSDRPTVLEFQKGLFFLSRIGPRRRGCWAAEPLSVVLKRTACVRPRMLLKAVARQT